MRRALCAALVLLASCGEPDPPRAAPAPHDPKALDQARPFEAEFDDAALGAAVLDAARHENRDALAALKLPPRCDRVRVAVRLLQSVLLDDGASRRVPGRAALLDAFGDLAKAQGGASPDALGPLVAAWRGWTDAHFAAEAALARRYAAAVEALHRPKLDAQALSAAADGTEPPPPMSATAAQIAMVRALALAASLPGDASVPQPLADAYAAAERMFAALHWPGGMGSLGELLADRLLAANPKSFRAQHLADLAQAAYARSKDELRASLVFLATSKAAERRGDVRAAENLASAARERLAGTPARGRELVDVLYAHGRLAQIVGKQAQAARELGRAWEESQWARLPVAATLPIAEPYAVALHRLGRFDEAYELTRRAAALHDDAGFAEPMEPLRTTLDEIAAQAALDLGRAAEARDLYLAAAKRYTGRPTSDGPTRERTDLLLAAQADLRAGNADAAVAAVEAVLAVRTIGPPTRAHASSILREAGKLAEAERELAAAESAGGREFTELLVEERARLAAARGDHATARDLFRRAAERVASADPERPAGWDAARVFLDWARMEEGLGRKFEASELADRAVGELHRSGLEMELDRARKLYADLQRQRLWFVDAEKVTKARLAAGPPGDAARRDDAHLDFLLLRIERLLADAKGAEDAAREAAGLLPEGWRRDVANALVARAAGADPAPAPPLPADASPRWRLVALFATGDVAGHDVAVRCGDGEPELRRWSARDSLAGAATVEGIEVRRRPRLALGAERPALAPDEALLLVEPNVRGTVILRVTSQGTSAFRAESDAGLADFFDAAFVEPTEEKLSAAARRVGEAVFAPALAGCAARRIVVSVPEPYGPLPFDLVPLDGKLLIEEHDVTVVTCAGELAEAGTRRAPALVSFLESPYSTLETRHALVAIGTPEPAVRTRLLALFGKFQNEGRDASAALRAAKLALRDEWKPASGAPPQVPAWARFVLRGAR